MRTTIHTNVRLPAPLREQLAVVAAAEQRSLSAIVVQLLDRGVAEKAREAALVREMLATARKAA